MSFIEPTAKWTLVVGAGISRGICPDWDHLAHEMVNRCIGATVSESTWKSAKNKFNQALDGWIQSAYNAISLKHPRREDADQEFYSLLESLLYSEFLSKAKEHKLEREIQKYLSIPLHSSGNYLECLRFVDALYGNTGNSILAKFLVDAAKQGRAPESVLTLNADTILSAMVRLEELRIGVSVKDNLMQTCPAIYKRSLRTIEDPIAATPIIHLHGSIFPKAKIRDSREYLIFLESSFHDVSGDVGNWAQTIFCNSALQSRIIFYGVSMTDPNIRRWLTWTTSIQNREITQHQQKHKPIQKHIWIASDPNDETIKKMMSASLIHLGVKVLFIDDWKHGGDKLLEILRLKAR